ncbi:MAG TPA: cysteine hydrolase [Bradyrhizobium sp.]|jgi:nicotinamidase-related amidase|nr:cysteine hydrolase [Bradyrhizobium sp.]
MANELTSARLGIVAIDLHRGHLDPSVATMPLAPDAAHKVTAANAGLFRVARAAGVPIFHCLATYRDSAEIASNPAWRARAADPDNPRKNVLRHNIKGMPGCEVMPEVYAKGDFIVDAKKRYDCFVATDLDLSLRAHHVDTLLITGVNTNSCVMATATAACCRDYAVIVVSDCVDTMDGPELHEAALRVIGTAFGKVMNSADLMAALSVKVVV